MSIGDDNSPSYDALELTGGTVPSENDTNRYEHCIGIRRTDLIGVDRPTTVSK